MDDNIVYQIFKKYLWEEKWSLLVIVFISFAVNFLQTNVISQITASIIDAIEHSNFSIVYTAFTKYVGISFLFLIFYFVGELFEMRMLTKLTQWMRQEFLRFIFYSNNESFETNNAIKYSSPINRVSFSAYSMISNIINYVLTNAVFILVITGYFLIKNTSLGGGFLLSNIVLALYIWAIWTPLMEKKTKYEDAANENESHVIDMLNNFDKIIYRGRAKDEMGEYRKRADNGIKTASDFFESMHLHSIAMYVLIYGTILGSIYYLIVLTQKGEVDKKTFIAFMSILLIYRDKLTSIVQLIPNFLEFNGRMEFAIEKLADLQGTYDALDKKIYSPRDLTFEHIEFRGVYYKYSEKQMARQAKENKENALKEGGGTKTGGSSSSSKEYLFEDLNLTIVPNHNIVGITGLSGRGKSTLMKLLLRMHPCTKGEILIDGVNVETVDPTYLRKNIVYVNQSSKLFDKKILENMMYGCTDTEVCDAYLKKIMSYPKIQGLYEKLDIEKGAAGPLGEKLSGGQRQIANIISGLVHPSTILILDEPTNALDNDLKMELLRVIDDFREYKKCILIITHDRDVFPLLDQKIEL